MEIIYDPSDRLDVADYGIDIPISFNNALKTMKELLHMSGESAIPPSGESMPSWYHSDLAKAPSEAELAAVHCPNYIRRLLAGGAELETEILRTFELIDRNGDYYRYAPSAASRPLSELFEIVRRRGGGVIRAAELALETGEAWYFGGGFHHAHWDFGSGFCFYSDTLAARERLAGGGEKPSAWIIDIDAHKGDGTADLVKRLNQGGDQGVIALSIHMARGWPLDERRQVPGYDSDPAWISSDIDIAVDAGEEGTYNSRLAVGLSELVSRSEKQWGRATPDIAFIVAGADPFEEDQLPSTQLLKLNRRQMLARNTLVRDFLRSRDIPAAWVQAGNYGDNAWKTYLDFLGPLLAE